MPDEESPLTWTSEMGNVSQDSDLEQVTRAAVVIACTFFDDLTDPDDLPRFNGSTYVSAVNDQAIALEQLCMAGLPGNLTGIQRATILTLAVRSGEFHNAHGGGEVGWSALGAELVRSRVLINPHPPIAPITP